METNKRTTLLALDLLSVPQQMWPHFVRLHETMGRWIKNEGNQGIKRSKQLFSFALDTLLGEDHKLPSWLKLSRKVEGIPEVLEDVWTWVCENPRVGLTLLRYSDLFTAILDDQVCLAALKPIISADARKEEHYAPVRECVLQFAERFKVPTLHVEVGAVPLFTKGPNGISILSTHKDSIALSREGELDPVMDLGNLIAANTEGISMSDVLLNVVNEPWSFGKDQDYRSGRVVFLAEKSAKIRVIAQGDYITQTVLKPIHDSLSGVLRRIPGDWTFDQEGGKEWVRKKTATAKWSASYDLSNATDRLPIDLQAEIIDRVLPGNLGQLWLRTMSGRQFAYTLPSGRKGFVKYAVGQPMGFYSSFPAFALLHHCLVGAAYEVAHGRPGKNFYAIIGDDMVIFDQAAGSVYLHMVTAIGGVINLAKSRVSDTKDRIVAEFAKAYFRNGTDLTPFSLKEVKSALENWANVPRLYGRLNSKLGVIIRAKKLKRMFQDYWPNEANSLVQLLESPIELGGFGKPGHIPLAKVLRGKSNTFRRYLAYRALEAYKVVVDISDDTVSVALKDVHDRRQVRIALQPFLSLLRDRQAEIGIPSIVSSRRGFLDWALSEDVPLSTLVRLVTLMTKELPTSLREKVHRPSVLWVRALADDKRHQTAARDSDTAYFYAFQELAAPA